VYEAKKQPGGINPPGNGPEIKRISVARPKITARVSKKTTAR
jgi:hypothetical protein